MTGRSDEVGAQRVVVGVDGTVGSRAALVYAWAAAAARGGALEVVGTYDVDPVWMDPADYDSTLADSLRASMEQAVSRLVRDVRADDAVTGLPEVPISIVVTTGPPAQTLVDLSRDAALLVVGRRGRGGARGAMLGSVALHCSLHARCPVVVAHPVAGDPAEPARVVVGIDGSERSRAALVAAVAEAGHRAARVEAVAAYELPDLWSGMASTIVPSAEQLHAAVEARAHAFVKDVMYLLVGEGGRPGVHVEIVEGPAHDVLVARAQGAALLVVGSAGKGELRSLLLGSVALHCAMYAPCPVMVVHPRPDRPAGTRERSEPAGAR
jgi:nucleotide-binding universal stress UspA family protein